MLGRTIARRAQLSKIGRVHQIETTLIDTFAGKFARVDKITQSLLAKIKPRLFLPDTDLPAGGAPTYLSRRWPAAG